MTKEIPAYPFPDYGNHQAKPYLDELKRLVSPSLFLTEYMDARSGASLVAHALQSYRASLADPRWGSSALLSKLADHEHSFNLVCAALFDLACNAEYIHGRVTNRNWIYCNRHHGDADSDDIHAYYSFLKQCPKCCQDRGLEQRLSGAQHKPSSHHIGEITTTAVAFFMTLLAMAGPSPMRVGVISKQSHDVDALAWRDDLLVLFEIKASPLVTYPLRVKLNAAFKDEGVDGPEEVGQHKLIDVEYTMHDISLYLANTNKEVPLGKPTHGRWPYTELETYVGQSHGLLDYLEAWSEVFFGYSVPKTERRGREVVLGYLANGWGDEIDSNKTKAGLGRTDDIKKGTYQLLKFGAYYRDGSPDLPIRGALVANLDPVFLYADYMAKLIDARWAPSSKFRSVEERPDYTEIRERDLFFIYDALLAFNRPMTNDAVLKGCFDFGLTRAALIDGELDKLLDYWKVRDES